MANRQRALEFLLAFTKVVVTVDLVVTVVCMVFAFSSAQLPDGRALASSSNLFGVAVAATSVTLLIAVVPLLATSMILERGSRT